MGFSFLFYFLFLVYVFSGAALGLPMESDFSIHLCILGILRDCSLGYLMYISLYPVVFLMLLCYLRVLQFFLGGRSAGERTDRSSLFPCPSVAVFWFEYLPKLPDPCWL